MGTYTNFVVKLCTWEIQCPDAKFCPVLKSADAIDIFYTHLASLRLLISNSGFRTITDSKM